MTLRGMATILKHRAAEAKAKASDETDKVCRISTDTADGSNRSSGMDSVFRQKFMIFILIENVLR